MDSLAVVDISRHAIYLLIKISLPILLVALFVGLAISLFQALTQIQEPTLSFVPKIIAIFFTLLIALNFIGSNMLVFTEEIMQMIANVR
ncbi:MAG: flagellar biosynthetic protein FliQ [Candidatus Midichloriaceae bacterium]|jgi:flagellar biosynthetic protein FliQ|nr:flagellar biosynthetic protein FliQ [Candidatus Midichloriaceae bacterium]